MVTILIDIPEDINKEVTIFKAKNSLSSKEEAIRFALSKFFKVKYIPKDEIGLI